MYVYTVYAHVRVRISIDQMTDEKDNYIFNIMSLSTLKDEALLVWGEITSVSLL